MQTRSTGLEPFDFLDRRDFVDDSVEFRVKDQHFIISDVYSVGTRELVRVQDDSELLKRKKLLQNCCTRSIVQGIYIKRHLYFALHYIVEKKREGRKIR